MKSQVGLANDLNKAQNGRKRVFVGLSGGVDSAVSAALLKKAGYDVTGVFIKVWQPDWLECTWREDRRDAMRAAAHIGIPFVTLDLEKEYKEGVVDYMVAEYRAGRTPNPDVMCNREVKFGAFWRWAHREGADFIATGHYARIKSGDVNTIGGKKTFYLLAGVDKNKDQSYFLWTLTPEDLSHTLFPVGDMTKPQVRRLAGKFGLPNAAKKDSQGLCFIGKLDFKQFLAHYIESDPGNVLDRNGSIIGKHDGATFFTIGERHGFRIDESHKTPSDRPYYVVSKDIRNNTITVSNNKVSDAPPDTVVVSGLNKVGDGLQAGISIKARCRYRQELEDVHIVSIGGDKATVSFKEKGTAITPGQSMVFYDGEVCLGGGIIC